MPINKPWTPYVEQEMRHLPGNLGVYEIGDADGAVVYIGYAGGRSLFGLKGVIRDHFSDRETNPILSQRAASYRYEINQMYLTRHTDLLMRHREDHGAVPDGNEASDQPLPRLGRFRWKSGQ